MQTCQRGGKPLIVFGEPAEADGPSEGTLNHPSPGQKDNARFAAGGAETSREDRAGDVFMGWAPSRYGPESGADATRAYSKRTPSERFTDLIVKDLLDLTHEATRRIEQMTSSLLFTGSFSYRLDSGETESLDYGTITPIVPTTKWDAATGSDPLGDLQSAVNQIVSQSGLMPDTLVLGANVMSVFLSHPQVTDVLNKLNVSLGAIQPSKPQLGTSQFIGRTYRPYLDLYGYAESYELEETPGTLVPMVPEDSALLGCSSSPATTSYGSITQTEVDGQIRSYTDVKFVPRQLSEPREEYHEVRIATRPCLIPFDLSSWAVINPLT